MLFNKVSFALTALISSSVVMMSGCTTSPSGSVLIHNNRRKMPYWSMVAPF